MLWLYAVSVRTAGLGTEDLVAAAAARGNRIAGQGIEAAAGGAARGRGNAAEGEWRPFRDDQVESARAAEQLREPTVDLL